jgi:hypothetical protein
VSLSFCHLLNTIFLSIASWSLRKIANRLLVLVNQSRTISTYNTLGSSFRTCHHAFIELSAFMACSLFSVVSYNTDLSLFVPFVLFIFLKKFLLLVHCSLFSYFSSYYLRSIFFVCPRFQLIVMFCVQVHAGECAI